MVCDDGVNVYSTRYVMTKKNVTYSLHTKQKHFDFDKIQYNMDIICNAVISYVGDISFKACSYSDFTQERVNELKFVRNVMDKVKGVFKSHITRVKSVTHYKNDGSLDLTASVEILNPKYQNALIDQLHNILSSDEKSALLMGMHCLHLPDCDGLEAYRKYNIDDYCSIVSRKYGSFESSYERLVWYIQYLKRMM